MRKLSFMLPTAILASVALATSLVIPGLRATAAEPAGLLVATGTVTNASGHPSPLTTVRLYAWLTDITAQRLGPGQSVPRTLLATVTSSASGTYALRVPVGALASVADRSGYVNFEADSGTGAWFFTRKAADPGPADLVKITGAVPSVCTGWKFQHPVKKAWGTVGQAYIVPSATHVHEKFYYGKGQSTTLGVGVSANAKFGSFSASGTESQSATSTEGFPGLTRGNILYQTLWKMALYKDACGVGGKITTAQPALKGWTCHIRVCWRYLVRSDGWASGDHELHPRTAPRTPSGNCSPYHAGGSFTTSTEKAVSWSGGLSVTQFGFGAEAQTGYDTTAQISFTFGVHRWLCGTNGSPPQASQLVARKYK